jgi:cell division protein FtsW
MTAYARDDNSVMSRWWWTIDRWSLAAVGGLAFVGAILVLAASPAVATRLGLDGFALAQRHFFLLPVAALALFGLSFLSPRGVRRAALIGFILSLALTAWTLVAGLEIKGAQRWIGLAGLSMQPSEFLKPTFAVTTAWLLSAGPGGRRLAGGAMAVGLLALVLLALLRQPDLGMSFLVAATWSVQVFLAGLPWFWVIVLAAAGAAGLVAAYAAFPHVALRIDGFIDPSGTDTYQIDRSLEAFANGGLFGRGPGEGDVKLHLPDAHSDFIFAVAGEEFGILACLVIVTLFAFLLLRGFGRLFGESSPFVRIAAAGLLADFGLQALINMGSALHLMPTKGMTLPFISYGGSSLIATSITIGMLLALSRRRAGVGDP